MERLQPRRFGLTSRSPGWLLVLLTSAAFTAGGAAWSAPPRYDGAGYAVLARALLSGQGYRAIDQADMRRHGHFPPGYPLLLAATSRVSGGTNWAFHAMSVACTLGATIASWWWFRRMMSSDAALILGLALGVNCLWARTGAAILSEPFYFLLCQLSILAASVRTRQWPSQAVWHLVLGVLLAGCVLTRHVGIALVTAVLLDRAVGRRWGEALFIAAITAVLISPWVVWLAFVGPDAGTQAGLFFARNASWVERIEHQLLFYVQRIPDQLTGPAVEFGTRAGVSNLVWSAVSFWYPAATACIAFGLVTAVFKSRMRLVALLPILTIAVLLPWPFLEAGRFLIPLLPCLLFGAFEGLSKLVIFFERGRRVRLRPSTVRRVAASLLLLGSLPYSVYALAAGRTKALETTQLDFDSACNWLVNRADRPGIVLSRHPGEVYWQTARKGVEVSTSEETAEGDSGFDLIAATIARYRVAYLLIDRERYAGAPRSALARFVDAHPYEVRMVWEAGGTSVFELISQR